MRTFRIIPNTFLTLNPFHVFVRFRISVGAKSRKLRTRGLQAQVPRPTMIVPSPDITKALVAELKALHERHQQFRTRVKAADEAASKRDEEARNQNAVLTQRIMTVESELIQVKESIEALRQFIELLPSVKSEFDSFEDEIEAFEVVGSDTSGLEHVASVIARVDALEDGVKRILKVDQTAQSQAYPVSPGITHTERAALQTPPADALTNRERLALILEFNKQPLRNGDVWFIIPTLWFVDWKKLCEEQIDQIGTEYRHINTSALANDSGELVESKINLSPESNDQNCMMVPVDAWNHLSNWYGYDSLHFPRLVMPDKHATRILSLVQRTFNLYFLLPPGVQAHGDFTPQIIVSKECIFKTLRSIIINSLPRLPIPHSIEMCTDCDPEPPIGWSVTRYIEKSRLLRIDGSAVYNWRKSIIVSIKVFDETRGCMVPIDPFPYPTSPPRILTWTPSCA